MTSHKYINNTSAYVNACRRPHRRQANTCQLHQTLRQLFHHTKQVWAIAIVILPQAYYSLIPTVISLLLPTTPCLRQSVSPSGIRLLLDDIIANYCISECYRYIYIYIIYASSNSNPLQLASPPT